MTTGQTVSSSHESKLVSIAGKCSKPAFTSGDCTRTYVVVFVPLEAIEVRAFVKMYRLYMCVSGVPTMLQTETLHF